LRVLGAASTSLLTASGRNSAPERTVRTDNILNPSKADTEMQIIWNIFDWAWTGVGLMIALMWICPLLGITKPEEWTGSRRRYYGQIAAYSVVWVVVYGIAFVALLWAQTAAPLSPRGLALLQGTIAGVALLLYVLAGAMWRVHLSRMPPLWRPRGAGSFAMLFLWPLSVRGNWRERRKMRSDPQRFRASCANEGENFQTMEPAFEWAMERMRSLVRLATWRTGHCSCPAGISPANWWSQSCNWARTADPRR
jgi:hypothetical protein